MTLTPSAVPLPPSPAPMNGLAPLLQRHEDAPSAFSPDSSPSRRSTMSAVSMRRRRSMSPTKSSSLYHHFDVPGAPASSSASFALTLRKVIGTTTVSSAGFAFHSAQSVFVTCAGSVVVWHHVGTAPDYRITQRFFRAHPAVAPAPVSSASLPREQPSTPTTIRKSRMSSMRASAMGLGMGSGSGSAASPTTATGPPASPTPLTPASNPGTPGARGGARQGNRAAACVALSEDGRTLAVGEVGYNPQIYIFACATDAENAYPVAALAEHSYGVRCVALSPDARWLASVGDVHDGYIFLWNLGSAGRGGAAAPLLPRLQASNKCTSTVNAMAWMGSVIVTVGLRHVKIWRPNAALPASASSSPTKSKFRPDLNDSPASSSSPGSRTLHGRNSILGDLLDSDFTCVAALSATRAVMGTDRGELCVLDDSAGSQKLICVLKLAYQIHCISVDRDRRTIWIGGACSRARCISFDELDRLLSTPVESNGLFTQPSLNAAGDTAFVGLATLSTCLVGVDSTRKIRVMTKEPLPAPNASVLKEYPSHRGSVLAPAAAPFMDGAESGFMTYDSLGALKLWHRNGELRCSRDLPLDQLTIDEETERNELKIARVCSSGKKLVIGDKYGILRMIDMKSWDSLSSIRAHHGEINDLAFSQQINVSELVASAGRDRSIQIFEILETELSLLQTIDQHTSSVTCLSFASDGKFFLSASADRTVAVYALASNEDSRAFLPLRVLTMKQSPVSMILDAKEADVVYVSTTDKQVHAFDIFTGQCTSSNRTADEKQNNAVLLSSANLKFFDTDATSKRLLVGASSTDKSVRVHDLESGLVVTHEYGHSEGVGGVTVLDKSSGKDSKSCQVVSTGYDGTVMLWDLAVAPRTLSATDRTSPVREMPIMASPLRRVLPRNTFADLSKSLEADGLAPIPQPNMSRGSSPTRRRMSAAVAATGSPKPQTPRARQMDRSPSPSTPGTPTQAQRGPPMRALALEPRESVCESAEALCRALCSFRIALADSPQDLSPDVLQKLDMELRTTLESVGKEADPRHRNLVEGPIDHVLAKYAERLAQLVEEKVAIGVASRASTAGSSDISNSLQGSDYASESDDGEPWKRLGRVLEE